MSNIPTWNKIEKRCPNGYHKDANGNCVDANGGYYQGKQEQPKQNDKPKTKQEKIKAKVDRMPEKEMLERVSNAIRSSGKKKGQWVSASDLKGRLSLNGVSLNPQEGEYMLRRLWTLGYLDQQDGMQYFKWDGSRASKKSTKKMKKSMYEIEDRFDELPDNLKEVARSLRSTLQVDDPVIDKRDGDYYFVFSYYDGDPEYYFDELNIQQNSAEEYNYLNLNEVARNPPRWMKSTKKMKKDLRSDGGTDDDYVRAFEYLDNGQVNLNGVAVDWYDMDDIVLGIEGFCKDKGRVSVLARRVLDSLNRGEDFSYDDQYTSHFDVTIQKYTKKMKKYHAHNSREYRVLLGGNVIDIPEKQNEYGWYYLDSDGDKPIREYVKHVVDDADRAKLLEICYDNWEHFGMYLIEVEEMFDKDPEYYKYQIVDWITWLLYNAIYSAKPTYSEPYFGITIETQDMQEEGEEALYYASTKKMKKSEEGITEEEIDDIDNSFKYDGWDVAGWTEYSSRLGFYRPWWVIRDVGIDDFGALQRITETVIPMKFKHGLDYEFSRHGDDHTVKLEFIIPYVKNGQVYKSAKKSYTPEYHDFRTMLTNMKITKDNRTVFKR